MEQKRGEGETKILKGGGQAGSKGGCLKKGENYDELRQSMQVLLLLFFDVILQTNKFFIFRYLLNFTAK